MREIDKKTRKKTIERYCGEIVKKLHRGMQITDGGEWREKERERELERENREREREKER